MATPATTYASTQPQYTKQDEFNRQSYQQHRIPTQQPSPPDSQTSADRSANPCLQAPRPTSVRHSSLAPRRANVHMADIAYPLSYLRSPVAPRRQIPVAQSLLPLHCKNSPRAQATVIPIWEEYEIGEVRESIEGGDEGFCGGQVNRQWNGYVEYRESGERWMLTRASANLKREAEDDRSEEWMEKKKKRSKFE